jgi:hypothetical protein
MTERGTLDKPAAHRRQAAAKLRRKKKRAILRVIVQGKFGNGKVDNGVTVSNKNKKPKDCLGLGKMATEGRWIDE